MWDTRQAPKVSFTSRDAALMAKTVSLSFATYTAITTDTALYQTWSKSFANQTFLIYFFFFMTHGFT